MDYKDDLFGLAVTMCIRLIFLGLIILFPACSKKPQVDPPGFSQEVFLSKQIEGFAKPYRYRVYVPKDRAIGERLPVMLYLHGSDERGDDNESQLTGPGSIIQAHPENFHFIVVFPQCPAGGVWDKDMIEKSMAALDQTVREYDGDELRLYLAGFSLGGYGAWTTAAMYPNKFAAVVPMSGRLLPRPGERQGVAAEILQLVDSPDPYAAFADRLRNTPIWIFHGANDPIVPVVNSRRIAKALKDAGNENFKYTELENTGHVSLTAAFINPELFEWLANSRTQVK